MRSDRILICLSPQCRHTGVEGEWEVGYQSSTSDRKRESESERVRGEKERKISQLIGLPHFGLDFLSVCSADRHALLQ